ncbi:MAG: RagB/SusD family nutrient uptake outer membrane protein [Leadbetterella sp.]|nr:RagB/SusD family nutrient uptake outer membrane protein [Leadbetterella sp.]
MSCTDLDVPIKSEITGENFPSTEEDFVAVASTVYSSLTTDRFSYYWLSQCLTTDEMIITANGGNWYDAGRWQQPHLHTYNPDNRVVAYTWEYGFTIISTANRVLSLLESSPESEQKRYSLAEIRSIRALALYWMMDTYGDIPLVTNFGDKAGKRTPRKEVFEFIETELKAAIPDLNTRVDGSTYGRPTKWMALGLLAKLYLNAEVYTGAPRWNDVIAACDEIIQEATTHGTFALDADYLKIFDVDNGPHIKDIIYAIPFHRTRIPYQYFARWWLHPLHRDKFELPYTPSGSARTLPEYYAKFNDPNDQRNKIWLTGKQYADNGSPILIETTKRGYDIGYSGPDASDIISVHLELTPEIKFRDIDKFDTGDDLKGRSVGYRCNKFFPDKQSLTRDQDNDFPVLRYADVLLMKAEAILRGGTPTGGQTALSLVNQVRQRAQAAPFSAINLGELLDERAREFTNEFWRRNDLIRFGRF